MIDQTFKIVNFDAEARQAIAEGVTKLTNAVKVTMGPSGKNVLIEKKDAPPVLTKDGVTVARAVNLRDRFANLGVQLVREAAQRTAEEAGDGTTTATVLANAIYQRGSDALNSGHDLRSLKEQMATAVRHLTTEVRNSALPISSDEDLLRVANISVNNESGLADLIVRAMRAVGDNGTVTVDQAKGFESSLEVVEGCELDRGYTSPYFVNKPSRMACELENPCVLVTDQRIASVSHIMHFMEQSARDNRPLVIISPEVTGDAMQALVMNTTKKIMRSCVLAAPEFGGSRLEALNDLCVLLGTDLLTGDPSEWRSKKLSDLGSCKKITSFRFRSIIVGARGDKDEISLREEEMKNALIGSTEEEASLLKRRLRRINSGIGILRVGGSTEAELGERKDRVEDALYATRAAMLEGVVAGGGSLLASIALESLQGDNLTPGAKVVYEAACEPLIQITDNCGGNVDQVLSKMKSLENSRRVGYNGLTDDVCDLIEEGILDPVMVTRLALQNAFSVAVNLLSVGCSMVEDDEISSNFSEKE